MGVIKWLREADRQRLLRRLQAAESYKIREQSHAIADMRQEIVRLKDELLATQRELTITSRDLKHQLEINARDRERVAWETARFSAQVARLSVDES